MAEKTYLLTWWAGIYMRTGKASLGLPEVAGCSKAEEMVTYGGPAKLHVAARSRKGSVRRTYMGKTVERGKQLCIGNERREGHK